MKEAFNNLDTVKMSLKTKIKNDIWRFNYIIPFVKKHQFDEKGRVDIFKHVLKAYKQIKPVKGSGKRSVGSDTKAILNQITIDLDYTSRFVYFIDTSKTIAVPGNIISNFTLAYDKVIHGTFEDLYSDAKGEDEYGKEAKLVAEGVIILANRIVEQLDKSSHPEKNKLIKYFDRMLSETADHFDEALQRILFFNQILWQTRHRLNGLGRLDMILGDLYEKDIQDGIITEKEAHIIVGDFLDNLSRYKSYKSDALEGDIGQIIVLGGNNEDGSYFFNDLTTIFLQEQATLNKPDPKTLLRVSRGMPNDILRIAVECLNSKTGSPLFSNDDVVIPALLDFGIKDKDAYSYCVSACWEPLVVGKSFAQNNISVFDFFIAFDEIMGEKALSYDELISNYIERTQKKFKEFLYSIDEIRWAKDPLVSLFTDQASERRIDISRGGCEYKNYGITTVALSNVIDSLLTIKRLVFDEKKYSLSELNEMRKADFISNSALYEQLKEAPKYYGHDEDEVVDLANKITASINELAKHYNNPLGGTVKFGLSSPGYNILSKHTPGDLSGRREGMPYNTHISCLDASYTEVVNFASKLDYSGQRFNGNVVDFFVSPGLIINNLEKFIEFMALAIKKGYFQLQMNVLDSKTLIKAKEHPENYTGLIVRVWGFSAYFNELPESYKEVLIRRALAAENAM